VGRCSRRFFYRRERTDPQLERLRRGPEGRRIELDTKAFLERLDKIGLIRSITLSYELPEAEAEAEKDRAAAPAERAGPGVKVWQSALWEYRLWINKFDCL
jgi:hypothetical protein